MPGLFLGAVVALALGGAGLVTAAALRVRSTAELILAAYVLAFAVVVGLSLLLSPFDAITRTALVVGCIAAFLIATAVWLLAGRSSLPPFPRPALALLVRSRALLVAAIVVALALAYVLALIAGTPPNGWDPLNYHLARAAFWLQSGHIGYIDSAYDERLNFNPPNGEIGLAFVLGVTRHENLAGLVQFFAAAACAVGVFALARRIGLGRKEATFGALLFLTVPIVLLQSSGVKNDVIVGSFLLAAAVFLLGDSHRELGLAALATALAVGTKFTGAYGLGLLVPLALQAPPRTLRAARVVSLGLGALAGSYWYVVNAAETGHLLGDQSNTQGLTAPFHLRENLLTAYGLGVDTLDASGAKGADLFLYAGLAAFAAIGFTVFHRPARDGARTGLLAGALIAAPLALVVVSSKLGRPGLVRLYDLLGEPQGYLATGDEVTSSPRTASDTGSWFGPMGLLLAVGTGIAGFMLARRRSLANVAGAFALAPVVWLGLLALTLTYHPWQGRFFVFPLALSAALWGLALRVSAAAWGAVALAAVTAGLSLVHYAEKPSGLRLLDRERTASAWQMERWEVQALHDPALAPLLRFLDELVPREDSIGLALGAGEFGYPAFGPELKRHVELVPFGSTGREIGTRWLLADAGRAPEIDATCWQAAFRSERGSVFRRADGCPAA